MDFLWRLHGVRETGDELEWNVRAPRGERTEFSQKVGPGTALLEYRKGIAELTLHGRKVATVRGTGRVITDRQGGLLAAVGTAEKPVNVTVTLPGRKGRRVHLLPNERVEV